MKIQALNDIFDKNGYKAFTKGHQYDVMMDRGEIVSVYCDLGAMYSFEKDKLNNFTMVD